MVIFVGCRFGAKYAIAHLNYIQIDFKDTILAPEELHQDCEIGFHGLAQIGAGVESEDVISRLLGDCAASACDAAVALVEFVGTADRVPIEATVVVELGILVVDDSGDEVGGDVLQWRPLVLYVQLASLLTRLIR